MLFINKRIFAVPSWVNRAFYHKPNGRKGPAGGGMRKGRRLIQLKPGELSVPTLAARLNVPPAKINHALKTNKISQYVVRTVPYGQRTASIFLEENVAKIEAKLCRGGRTRRGSTDDTGAPSETQSRNIGYSAEPKRTTSQAEAQSQPATVSGSIDLPSGIIPQGTIIGKRLRNGNIATVGKLEEDTDLTAESKFAGMIRCKIKFISEYIRQPDLLIWTENSWKSLAN